MNTPYPLYEIKRVTNLRQLIDYRADESASAVAFEYETNKGITEKITFSELKYQINALGTAFYNLGLRNCHVAILGENSYDWLLNFFALVCGNIVTVPLDRELPVQTLKNMIKNSNCSALIFSDTYTDIAEQLENELGIIIINMRDAEKLIKKGASLISEGYNEYLNHNIDESSVVIIVYTSGTTGTSKGVMLSHSNLAYDTYSFCHNCKIAGNTVLLLPLHHTFGLVVGVFTVMLYGYTVYINLSLRHLMSDLIKVKPKILFLVPLLAETLYKNIWKIAEQNGTDKTLADMITKSNKLLADGIDNRKQLFQSFISPLGGNLDTIVCGGAPLNSKYIRNFRELGINLLNGYGITECSPVISVNRNNYYKDGSVGQVINVCSVMIDNPNNGTGEICVKGLNVMLGYYHMEDETAKVLENGWFHTGDIGYLDEENFLFITGRIKNTIILNNGENVSPEELEEILQDIPIVNEVIVFEDNGKIAAEIFPDLSYAEKNKITDILAELKVQIKHINDNLPKFKQINSVYLRDSEFEKTTTKKIKRKSKYGNN